MADLFATNNPELTEAKSMGNLFGEGIAAQKAAQQAMMQRQMQLQEAQLNPAQAAAFRAAQSGTNIGNAIGGLINPPRTDPRQEKLSALKQAVDMEAQQSGIQDPADYFRLASSRLLQAGEYQYALEAKKQADALAKEAAGTSKTKAEAEKMTAETGKITSEEGRAKETEWLQKFKLGAEIDKLQAEAKKLTAEAGTPKPKDRESLNEMAARITEFVRLQKAAGKPVHPADEAALATIKDMIEQAPQPTIQSEVGKMIAEKQKMQQGAAPAANAPAGKAAGKYQVDAQGYVNIPVGQGIPKDLPKGTKIRQGSRTGTVK